MIKSYKQMNVVDLYDIVRSKVHAYIIINRKISMGR